MPTSSPTISDYYEYAKLSTASYVTLEELGVPAGSYNGNSVANLANTQTRLPLALARQMFLMTPQNPNPWIIPSGGYYGVENTTNGFAATLFVRGSEKVLAIRGTEAGDSVQRQLDLLQTDLGGIGVLGMGLPQAISMVNYILRLITPAQSQVMQLQAHTSTTLPEGPAVRAEGLTVAPGVQLPPVYIYFTTSTAPGLGLIAPGEQIKVTGHSLGGHLGALAQRLFPSLISEAYTYNAPGFDPSSSIISTTISSALASQLRAQLGDAVSNIGPAQKLTDELVGLIDNYVSPLSGGASASFDGLARYNFESEDLAPQDDISLVSSVLTADTALGYRADVTTERDSHLIEPFMDSLSLQALLYKMNNSLTLRSMTELYQVASTSDPTSQEKLLEPLYKLLLGTFVTLQIADAFQEPDGTTTLLSQHGIGAGSIVARRDWYDKLIQVENVVKAAQDAGAPLRFESLVNQTNDAASMALSSTPEGLAYRYALVNLNPFAVIGANYAIHNASAELDLYDSATGNGTLTPQYLEDRAAFSRQVFFRNTADLEANSNGAFLIPGDTSYRDQKTSIALSPILEPTPRLVLFGDIANDSFTGSTKSDHIYGGAGDDTLTGLGGDDYLEGNAGSDSLHGDAGRDVLVGGAGIDSLYGGTEGDILDGGNDSDTLRGEEGVDTLCGGKDNDTLIGGKDNDFLEGGEGTDTYSYSAGDGNDFIRDTDGLGQILIKDALGAERQLNGGNKVHDGLWVSYDGKTEYLFSPDAQGNGTLTIQAVAEGGQIIVENFHSGRLGIALQGLETHPPRPEITQHLTAVPSPDPNGHPALEVYNTPDLTQDYWLTGTTQGDFLKNAAFGDDELEGMAGADIIVGGAGNDYAYGDYKIDVMTFVEASRTGQSLNEKGTGSAPGWAMTSSPVRRRTTC
jgi:Ca2+-binding RTX toxin-like protein